MTNLFFFLLAYFLVILLKISLLYLLIVFRFVQRQFPRWNIFCFLQQTCLQPAHKLFYKSNILFPMIFLNQQI